MNLVLLAWPLAIAFTVALVRRERWPRLAIESFPTPARRALALSLLTLVLAIACFAPPLSLESGAPGEPLGEVRFGSLFLGHGLLAGFLLLWWVLAERPDPRRFLSLRSLRRDELGRELQLGAAAGAAAWAVTMTVMALAATAAGIAASEDLAAGAAGDVPEVVRWIVGLPLAQRFLLVVSAGVVEEAFFRAFLQARSGILVSSLLFASSHANYGLPLMLVGVFTVSVVLGWLFRVRGNIVPCMVAHAVFDGVQLFLILPAVVGSGGG